MRSVSREIKTPRGVTYQITGALIGKTVRVAVEQIQTLGSRRQSQTVYGIPTACKIAVAEIRAELEA